MGSSPSPNCREKPGRRDRSRKPLRQKVAGCEDYALVVKTMLRPQGDGASAAYWPNRRGVFDLAWTGGGGAARTDAWTDAWAAASFFCSSIWMTELIVP